MARDLIGCRLVTRLDDCRTSGLIVETEAYLANGDSACHGARGPTQRTQVMFGVAGVAYVYPIHAKHCFNVVTGHVGAASAVLIRAIKPVEGIAAMSRRRGTSDLQSLASGPAKLCQSLSIDRSINALDLTIRRKVWLEAPEEGKPQIRIRRTERIGVTSAKHLELRFVAAGSPFASGPKYMR